MHFKIITSVRNAEQWIERCMASVMTQTHTDWEHVIVDDRSTDSTLARALTLIGYERGRKPQHTVIAQIHKQPSHLMNQCLGIDSVKPGGDDVIVILDGDDWLHDDTVLERLERCYKEHNCLMTYGTPVLYRGEDKVEPCYPLRPYTHAVLKAGTVRQQAWAATHLRTFKYKLWRRIDQRRSFYLRNGEMVWCCADFAQMFPMLEMAAERAHYISSPMVVYNTANDTNFHKRFPRDQILAVDREIREMTPYARVEFN